MRLPAEHEHKWRAIELALRHIAWFAMGVRAAPTWFGRRLDRAANDEHFQ
jgi:hypothetical protein